MAGRYPQITAHVSAAERAIFEAYSRAFGLDAGNLLHLLWQRELRFGRLDQIDGSFQDPGPALKAKGLDSKVTAHLSDAALKARIRARAEAIGMPVSRAGAMLLREEMQLRWLEIALDLGDSN